MKNLGALTLALFSIPIILGRPAQAQSPSTKTTVAVGNCQPQLVSYSTVSEAVAAVKKNSTVIVCPGTYPEQVTITQSLTLTGLADEHGNIPIIAVPTGGLVSVYGQATQISVGRVYPPVDSVNISNVIVDGANSGIDCSTGAQVGIDYAYVTAVLISNVEVRNQNPGGCGFGIMLQGGEHLNVRNSYVHDFDNIGITATLGDGGSSIVNLASNSVASASTSVQAGIEYGYSTHGLASHNTIVLAGGTGLWISPQWGPVTARENTITGASVGILSSPSKVANIIIGNHLSNNGTGIIGNPNLAGLLIKSNSLAQSAITAIDLECNQYSTAEHNTISDAPIGIADIASGDIVTRNKLYNVTTPTTTCP